MTKKQSGCFLEHCVFQSVVLTVVSLMKFSLKVDDC